MKTDGTEIVLGYYEGKRFLKRDYDKITGLKPYAITIGQIVIDAEIPNKKSWARFINDPRPKMIKTTTLQDLQNARKNANVKFDEITKKKTKYVRIVLIKNIAIGEEVLANYDDDSEENKSYW
jgi:hypothetical protein